MGQISIRGNKLIHLMQSVMTFLNLQKGAQNNFSNIVVAYVLTGIQTVVIE